MITKYMLIAFFEKWNNFGDFEAIWEDPGTKRLINDVRKWWGYDWKYLLQKASRNTIMPRAILGCEVLHYFFDFWYANTFKFKRTYNALFQIRGDSFRPLFVIPFEIFSPTLAKNELNWFEISVLFSIFWPFIVKNAGKSFLSLHLFKISLIVDQVCLIFDFFCKIDQYSTVFSLV